MFERAQSENIGVILLTAVITLTITGAGAVVLSEWQADIQEGPIADIESEMTPINATLEHRGGDTLYPNETTIKLVGVDEAVTLSDPFAPGTSEDIDTSNFSDGPHGFLDGRFELLVIHDPTETVVHSETHDVDPTLERLEFEIANESDPAYVLKDKPANYTVEEVFDFKIDSSTVTRNATDRANLTVEDSSKLDVNERASTITGLDANSTVNVTAEVRNETTETEVLILESDPPLDVQTSNVTATSATTVEVTGNLTRLGGLPDVDLGFEYTPYRKFNRDSDDNGDGIVTYDEWRLDPDGYGVERYMHDNRQLEPGETRVYMLNNTESGVEYEWYFRNREWTRTGWIQNDFHRTLEQYRYHPQGTYRMEVTVAGDGSTADVILYEDTEGDDTRHEEYGVDLEGNDEVYFSLHQRGGGTGADSMRLLNVYQPNGSIEVDPDRDVSSEEPYSREIGGLDIDRPYGFRAVGERAIGGQTVVDTGSVRTTRIKTPTMETRTASPINGSAIKFRGELVDIGDLQRMNLSFEYTPYRKFNRDSDDNSDGIVTHDEWRPDPDGYGVERYMHDNRQLEPGETRVYTLNNTESGVEYEWYFRDSEYTRTSRIRNDFHRTLEQNLYHPEDTYRMEVTVAENGSTADVVLYEDTETGEIRYDEYGVSLNGNDEVYFSLYQRGGGTGPESLRLLDVHQLSDSILVNVDQSVSSEGLYSTEIEGLDFARQYGFRAIGERDTDGSTIRDIGSVRTARIDTPKIETRDAHTINGSAIKFRGDLVDLGDFQYTDLSFEYTPYRDLNRGPDDNGDEIVANGEWRTDPDGYGLDRRFMHDNRQLEPGETRVYVLNNTEPNVEYEWYFRDNERTATGSIGDYFHRTVLTSVDHPQGTYRMEVTVADDGSTADVILYEDTKSDELRYGEIDISLEGNDEVYFSLYQRGGESGPDSLRLLHVYQPSDFIEVDANQGVSSEGVYSKEISGLDANRTYEFRAISERIINGSLTRDTGIRLLAKTDS